MTEPSERLIVIPARGGSKRLPRKNIRSLAGKPLICWTIEAALRSGVGGRIVVSSEDAEILEVASRYLSEGVIAHERPSKLSTDDASTIEVLAEALETEQKAGHNPNTLILLQPTSPLRMAHDILGAFRRYEESVRSDTVVSVCEVDHPTAWVGTIEESDLLSGIDFSGKRSQEYQKEYRINGAIYILDALKFQKSKSILTKQLRAFIMPRDRSIDIDSELDFKLCENVIRANNYAS